VDADVAEEGDRFKIPDQLPVIDGLLAASAKVRGWSLVTRNVTDAGRSRVSLLNLFDPPTAS
jgi:predicted nucleic acid-binding protein